MGIIFKKEEKNRIDLPVLFQIILPFEALSAHLTAERYFWTFVAALVYHQVVRLGESTLTVLADVFAFGPHFSAEFSTAHVVVQLHYRKHSDS